MLPTIGDVIGIVVGCITIIGALSGFVGWLLAKRRAQNKIICDVNEAIKDVAARLTCIESENAERREISIATLRLSFAVGRELVNNGANSELRKAVNELQDVVLNHTKT